MLEKDFSILVWRQVPVEANQLQYLCAPLCLTLRTSVVKKLFALKSYLTTEAHRGKAQRGTEDLTGQQ